MTTDGKYCSLAYFKQFIGTGKVDPLNPTVYNGAVQGTPDDNVLSNAILNAESAFELEVGTGYDQQTYANVSSITPFVDGNGWLHLFARERGPVTAVTGVQIRDLKGRSASWSTVAFTADNVILPPFETTHPWSSSWHVRIFPISPLVPRSTGQIAAQWSYTGGYATIPNSLIMLIAEAANYIYKLREAPMGTVINQPLGTMTVPANMPPHIRKQFQLWRPSYS